MIQIINSVINERIMNNDSNTDIQLSSVFMQEFLKQVSHYGTITLMKENVEVKYSHNGTVYRIINRNLRDDNNSPDVEKEILNRLFYATNK